MVMPEKCGSGTASSHHEVYQFVISLHKLPNQDMTLSVRTHRLLEPWEFLGQFEDLNSQRNKFFFREFFRLKLVRLESKRSSDNVK